MAISAFELFDFIGRMDGDQRRELLARLAPIMVVRPPTPASDEWVEGASEAIKSASEGKSYLVVPDGIDVSYVSAAELSPRRSLLDEVRALSPADRAELACLLLGGPACDPRPAPGWMSPVASPSGKSKVVFSDRDGKALAEYEMTGAEIMAFSRNTPVGVEAIGSRAPLAMVDQARICEQPRARHDSWGAEAGDGGCPK